MRRRFFRGLGAIFCHFFDLIAKTAATAPGIGKCAEMSAAPYAPAMAQFEQAHAV
jgi:hypothetical protein